jgi:hypothetical protein
LSTIVILKSLSQMGSLGTQVGQFLISRHMTTTRGGFFTNRNACPGVYSKKKFAQGYYCV